MSTEIVIVEATRTRLRHRLPGRRIRSSAHAPFMNTNPPKKKMIELNTNGT